MEIKLRWLDVTQTKPSLQVTSFVSFGKIQKIHFSDPSKECKKAKQSSPFLKHNPTQRDRSLEKKASCGGKISTEQQTHHFVRFIIFFRTSRHASTTSFNTPQIRKYRYRLLLRQPNDLARWYEHSSLMFPSFHSYPLPTTTFCSNFLPFTTYPS